MKRSKSRRTKSARKPAGTNATPARKTTTKLAKKVARVITNRRAKPGRESAKKSPRGAEARTKPARMPRRTKGAQKAAKKIARQSSPSVRAASGEAAGIPTLILAADHRIQLRQEAEKRGRSEDQLRRFKMLIAEAFLSARARSEIVRRRGGLILDPELGDVGIRLARAADVAVGEPAEIAGPPPLRLYADFLARRPSFVKCLVNGRPDDPPDAFHAQNATVERLEAACGRARIPLVLELIVPRRPAETDETFERLRPELTADWMRSLNARGVRPAYWKLEGFDRPDALAQVIAACEGGSRVLILGKSVPFERLTEWFRVARGEPKCDGFAVGRTIFWDAFIAFLDGATSESTIARIRDAYLRAVEAWE